MFYGSSGTDNSMVAFFFDKFGLRKDQCQAKLGHIRSNFEIQIFLTESRVYLAQFCFRIPKMSFVI